MLFRHIGLVGWFGRRPLEKKSNLLLEIAYFGLYSSILRQTRLRRGQSPDHMVVDNPIPALNVSLKTRMLPRGDSEGVFECENN